MKKKLNNIFQFKEEFENRKVLFVHGFNSSHKFVIPIFDKERSFCIHSFDFPGCGHTLATEEVSIEKYADLLWNLLDKYEEPITVVAHSLGGAIVNYVAHHHNIKNIILIAPVNPYMSETVGNHKETKNKETFEIAIKKAKSLFNNTERKEYIKYMAKSTVNFFADAKHREKYMKRMIYDEMLNPIYLSSTLYNKYKKNLKPTFIIQGESDYFVPKETSKKTASKFGWDYFELPSTGHAPLAERPSRTLEIIEKILKAD